MTVGFQHLTFNMNSDTLAIALDRLRFYANDAVVTAVNVGALDAWLMIVHMQAVSVGVAELTPATRR